ncbi:putative integral membrane protein [Frankia canadensis]|uniref:Putative integral membrane protein n=1 Tax=Frankia canadensis TaxID=1836972 RepID=A0A2I2KJK7_9ACTN|nr:DUF4129 domain-containing protein [Frankia canadensis]SNQ45836.1 putative integral membrane protein [Frankia canadensis]SOU53126.1 putative integral membrane protein [Frankia canadensis]
MTLGGPVSRDGARDEAHRELSRAIYQGKGPSWWDRALGWMTDRVSDLLSRIFPHDGPGGGSSRGLGALALVVVLVLAVVAARWWLGPVHRTARAKRADQDDLSSPLTAAQLRAQAERYAVGGDYTMAVRSRLRAIARMMEEKGVLDPRPGRTAGELVADVAAAIAPGGRPPTRPVARESRGTAADEPLTALAAAVDVFSETWYGGRPGSRAGYQVIVDADATLSRVRGVGGGRDDAADTLAVPV